MKNTFVTSLSINKRVLATAIHWWYEEDYNYKKLSSFINDYFSASLKSVGKTLLDEESAERYLEALGIIRIYGENNRKIKAEDAMHKVFLNGIPAIHRAEEIINNPVKNTVNMNEAEKKAKELEDEQKENVRKNIMGETEKAPEGLNLADFKTFLTRQGTAPALFAGEIINYFGKSEEDIIEETYQNAKGFLQPNMSIDEVWDMLGEKGFVPSEITLITDKLKEDNYEFRKES